MHYGVVRTRKAVCEQILKRMREEIGSVCAPRLAFTHFHSEANDLIEICAHTYTHTTPDTRRTKKMKMLRQRGADSVRTTSVKQTHHRASNQYNMRMHAIWVACECGGIKPGTCAVSVKYLFKAAEISRICLKCSRTSRRKCEDNNSPRFRFPLDHRASRACLFVERAVHATVRDLIASTHSFTSQYGLLYTCHFCTRSTISLMRAGMMCKWTLPLPSGGL